MKRSFGSYLMLCLRGMAMGGADVIPGVSGGTIAFITGIYEELIKSIKSINAAFFKKLIKEGISSAWRHINGNFLLAVVSGILISVFSLARAISWLLTHYPMIVWAFFFGLIIGSAIFIGQKIGKWRPASYISIVAGSIIAYYVTVATPATTPESTWFIFVSGAIALCALILPGISGAFILVLLGKYEFMLNAVRDFRLDIITIFVIGGVLGVIAFSNVISWLFRKHPNATLALLSGFMIGSLNKLWPWKKVVEWRINSQGAEVPFLEKSISPFRFAEIYATDPRYAEVFGHNPSLWIIIISMVSGMALILAFNRLLLWQRSLSKPGR